MFTEALENETVVLEVPIGGSAGDEEVVHVRIAERKTSENHVHESLESLRGISEAEGHANKLKETELGGHGRFVDISGFDRNLVVCTHQVQLGKDSSAAKGRGKVLYVLDWVSVWDGDAIQSAIITTRVPVTRGLLGHHV